MKHLSVKVNGFSLIEVLIATLILAFGIASIGMMMLATVQNSRSALLRSRAVEFAQDMAERIRNNAPGRQFYDTAITTPADNDCFQDSAAVPAPCTSAALAAHDIWHWQQQLSNVQTGLPSPLATITQTGTPAPPNYAIRIQWTNGQAGDGTAIIDSYTLQVRL